MPGPSTTAVHAGERIDSSHAAVNTPIVHSTTYHHPERRAGGQWAASPYIYTRYENPTVEAVEEKVRALEGDAASGAFLFASGMAAETALLSHLLTPGDVVAIIEGAYGGTMALLQEEFVPRGITVSTVPADEPDRIPADARLVWAESITNPLLDRPDLDAWSAAAKRVGARFVVDATFATPLVQRPFEHGADFVIHSATKYMNGHSDVTAGVVLWRDQGDRKGLWTRRRNLGATLDPAAANLVGRGIKTLALRMQRHQENAAAVARAAEGHPQVAQVRFPGVGGMVTLDLSEGAAAIAFRRAVHIIQPAASLGGIESLVSLPMETSHAYVDAEARRAIGIGDGLVRISCGIEDPEDLVHDVLAALDAAANA